MATEAGFLPVDGSDRFYLLHLPEGAPRGAIVYLHPFAEEMNRSRRVVARQARAFAVAGYVVLQVDLFGCGDSAGDFGDASWARWRADARAAANYVHQRFDVPICLWGLRGGGLLACELAFELDFPVALLLWQPVLSGKQHLQQFLRLSLAADILDGKAQGGTDALLAELSSGRPVEVAGYTLAPELASGLAESSLSKPPARQHMHCIEIAPGASAISPALQRFKDGGVDVSVCDDAQCWLTPGVQACPALEATSLAVVEAMLP